MTSLGTLNEYGHNFQIKLLSCIITDKMFLQQIIDILESSYFDSDSNVKICDIVKKYFKEYSTTPTLEVLATEVKKFENEVVKSSIKENLKEVIRYFQADDLQYIKDEALKFCKNQVLKQAILESVNLLEAGKYDAIKKTIDVAMKAGSDSNVGLNYKVDIKERYKEDKRFPVKIGFDPIDDITQGGLGRGELGIIAGGPGAGKSYVLVNIASFAANHGLFVVHYTLELGAAVIAKRFDAVNTGITMPNLIYHLDEIEDKIKDISGEVMIKEFPPRTVSVNGLIAHLERIKLLYRKPDLIIVDYADLLRDDSINSNIRNDLMLNNIYTDLRGVAGIFECPLFTASQVQRSSAQLDIIEGDKIEGAWSKLFVADLVISISRKTEDKISGTGRFHIIKNRNGPEGLTFPSKLNFANGRMNLYEMSSESGKEVKKEMDNSEITTRKYLGSKMKELGLKK